MFRYCFILLCFLSLRSEALENNAHAPASFVTGVVESFKSVRPDLTIERIESTDVVGVYEVIFREAGSVYGLGNGDYFFSGDIIRIEEGRFIDVKQEKLKGPRAAALAKLPLKELIVFPAKGEAKAHIYVFTDVDCGYCRQLHSEVPELNSKGVEVRYLAYPRAGAGSGSFNKIASAWCATDQNAALTKLKNGQEVPIDVCQLNPVESHYELGAELGVTGTPAIFLSDGKLLPGYLPSERLLKEIGIE